MSLEHLAIVSTGVWQKRIAVGKRTGSRRGVLVAFPDGRLDFRVLWGQSQLAGRVAKSITAITRADGVPSDFTTTPPPLLLSMWESV